MSDKVKCRKMTTAAFGALANKRADTIYFVNATGDFDPQSMNETDGDIYLGDKLLTGKPSPPAFPACLPGPRVSIDALDPFGEYDILDSAYNAQQNTRIDTGISTYNDDVEFHIRFKQTQNGIYMRLFGADTSSSNNDRYRIGFIALNTTAITLCCRSTTGALTSTITRVRNHVYTLSGKLLNGSITLFVRDETTGETDLQTGTYDVDTGYAPQIRLFYLSTPNAYQASGTHVYRAMLKVKGRTVLNYVPATRKADGEVGFIDTATGSFVAAATGTWLAGDPAAAGAHVVTADPPDIPIFAAGGDTNPPTPGADGLVPAPTFRESAKFLRGDGTWDFPAAPYGNCYANADNQSKLVNDLSVPFRLVGGAVVLVNFWQSNTAANPTLNVMGTGAKPIKRYNNAAAGTATYTSWNTGSVQCLVYDATTDAWMLIGWLNSTYSNMQGAAADANGSRGLVPQPHAGDHVRFLRGDGLWADPPDQSQYLTLYNNGNDLLNNVAFQGNDHRKALVLQGSSSTAAGQFLLKGHLTVQCNSQDNPVVDVMLAARADTDEPIEYIAHTRQTIGNGVCSIEISDVYKRKTAGTLTVALCIENKGASQVTLLGKDDDGVPQSYLRIIRLNRDTRDVVVESGTATDWPPSGK